MGQIVSWPFFGSNRGGLQHPEEINRGPWASSYDYLLSCAEREVNGVILENEGKSAPHRLHLDPDEIETSRHHHLRAVPGDQSDDSDEYDLEESEAEWDGGAGDAMYSDYRRMQRSTFLIAHLRERENRVREEMSRFLRIMERLGVKKLEGVPTVTETFALDCHDLNSDNIFVDEKDNTTIVSHQRCGSFARALIRGYDIDLHHRLGVYDDPPSLGVRACPSFPPQQPFHRSTLPAGGREALKQTSSDPSLSATTTRILCPTVP